MDILFCPVVFFLFLDISPIYAESFILPRKNTIIIKSFSMALKEALRAL